MTTSTKKFIVRTIDDGYGDVKGYNGESDPNHKRGIAEDELNSYDFFRRTGKLLLPSHVILDVGDRGDGFEQINPDPYSYIRVKYEGRYYLVGLGAVDEDSNAKWNGAENKHDDMFFPVLFATTLGILATSEKEIVDLLVMALPVKEEKKPHRKEQLKALALGKVHEVEIELPLTGEKFNREVSIKNVMIHRQPFGSLNYLMLDDMGRIVNEAIAAAFNYIGDIGTKTFNWYTLQMLKNIESLSDNSNDGMMEAYRRMNNDFARITGDRVADGKLNAVIKSGQVDGISEEQFTNIKNFQFKYQAQIVSNVASNTLTNVIANINNIIWTGGGSEEAVLKPHLEEIMQNGIFANKNVYYLGRFATVVGLWRFGLHTLQKVAKKKEEEEQSASQKKAAQKESE